MAVTDIFWFQHDGYDVHVIRNGPPSRPLIQDLVLEIDDDDLILATDAPTGVSVRFEANFAGLPAVHGLRFDTAIGSVTALIDAPPDPQLRSFVISALVRDVGADADFEAVSRVHIHGAVERIWLTPETLSVRQGVTFADKCHFGVLARFDDHATGEIFNWPGLIWRSANPQKVAVTADGLEVASVGEDLVEVSLSLEPTLYPAPRPPDAQARVRRLEGWPALAASVPVRPVAAGRPAGRARPVDEATNVLFLSEGFPPEEQTHFEDIVTTTVYHLRTMRTVRPLNIVGGAINYWRAFVPFQHATAGLTVLSECLVRQRGDGSLGGAEADQVEPTRPTAPTPSGPAAMNLPNLVFEVGLPVPADDAPPLGPVDADTKRSHWKRLYGTDSTGTEFTADRVPDHLYARWLRLLPRALIDEVDTCFGMALGGRPRLEREALTTTAGVDRYRAPLLLHYHPHRTSRDHFEQVVSNLRVGRTSAGSAGSGAIWVTGKDRGLVCLIVRAKRGRARFSSNDGNLFLPMDDADFHVLKRVDDRVQLVPGQLPSVSNRKLTYALTFAHEVSHAFGLGDEYGSERELTSDREDQVERDIASDGNLQLQRALRAASGTGLDPSLVRQQLRWAWPRVRAGGVLALKPKPDNTLLIVGNVLTLTLLPGHGQLLRQGDLVFLRRRPLAEQTHLIPWLRIEAPPDGDELLARVILGILDPDPVNSALFVGEHDKTSGQQASVLLAAVLRTGEPMDPNTGVPRFLPLVAPTIVEHIASSRGPLDAPKLNPTIACNPVTQARRSQRSPFTVPTNLPDDLLDRLSARVRDNLRQKRFLIIGLYQGGRRFHCGVFHPGGVCLMNEASRHRRGKHRFCQVCQYLLIDRLDPVKHGAVDEPYGRDFYPEPRP